jgi:hypothetical protein
MKGDFSRSTFRSEKHYSHVLVEQGRVQVDADWNEQQSILLHRLNTEASDLIGQSGTPIKNDGFLISLSADGKSLTIGKGHYYVDGMLCENEADVPFLSQPDLPTPLDPLQSITAAQKTAGVLYLDAWYRHLTVLDDPQIREVALNGPETSTRSRTVWQVKVLPVNAPAAGLNPQSDIPEWDALVAGSTGMMNARTQPTLSTDNPCLIPPTAGYQSLENQLYRVEIHQPGPAGTATFKWSRDNGSVETRILSINANQVTVQDLGADDVLGFSGGQTVELLTDHHDLNGLPGQLLTIDSVTSATNIVTLKTAPNTADLDLTLHPRMRRWDSQGAVAVPNPTGTGVWIPLENGVQVQFTAGSYSTGDYWLIPARTVTGEIEWPPFAIPNSAPIAQPSAGIRHHYSRLGFLQLVNPTAQGWQLQSWRNLFPALTDVPSPDGGIHVTGISMVNPASGSASPLINDTTVQAGSFGGIDVLCDADVDPASISRATCFLTVENPLYSLNQTLPDAYDVLALAGTVSTSPNTISWRPTPNALNLLNNQIMLQVPPNDRGILTRLSLKGNFIWSRLNHNLYLDGEAFGVFVGGASNTFLGLPSGDNRRGGDFEMWFWLVAAPVALSALSLPQSTMVAGTTMTGSIVLSDKAPVGGLNIAMASTNPALVALVAPPATPANIVIPAGSNSASFTLQAAANATGQATITATLNQQSVAVTVTVLPLPTLTGSLALSQSTILVGRVATGTITLSGPAPSAPSIVVALASSNAAVASVPNPPSLTVPVNSVTASFLITAVAPGTTTISAKLGTVSLAAPVTVVKGKDTTDKVHIDKTASIEKITIETLPQVAVGPSVGPVAIHPSITGVSHPELEGPTGRTSRAFIRPEERPPVGEVVAQDAVPTAGIP